MLPMLPNPAAALRGSPPRPRCLVCRHPQRHDIDLALVAGESLRRVAARHGLSHSCLARHKLQCIPTDLFQARRSKVIGDAEFVLGKVIELPRRAELLLNAAVLVTDRRSALAAIGELRRLLELQATMARATGAADAKVENSDLDKVKEAILHALADHPAARAAVAQALAA